MARYLFALTDGGGTVPPEIGVARRLVERGHSVSVFADPSMSHQVAVAGASFTPWTIPTEVFRDWEIKNPMELGRTMADVMISGPASGQAADITRAIDAARPDLVVTSFFAMGGMIGAEARGVPFDVLIPNAYTLPADGMPALGMGFTPARGPLGRLRDRIVKAGSSSMLDRFTLATLNAARAENGLGPIAHGWDQIRHARRQLVLTSSSFDFPATLPDRALYVGPILDDPAWASAQPWTEPAGADPLVLVALSSTFQNQVDCLQRIVDALGTLPVRGVVTTGPTIEPEALTAPANVTVVQSAPHSAILREAALVVTHGGHGTVVKTLAAGVPMVILHHGRDQADNAARVTARGAGVAISRTSSSPKIAAAVDRVLGEPRYQAAAERLGEAITRDAGSPLLIDELERR